MKQLKLSLDFSGEQVIGCINSVASSNEITRSYCTTLRKTIMKQAI